VYAFAELSLELTTMVPLRVRQIVVAIVLLMVARPLLAQQGPPADVDEYVGRSMKTFEVPGMAVAIVKDGRVVLLKGYGVRKLGEHTPVDENTLFGIGSNTKAFTAAALATLVDEGKISWDDPVYERLKGFEMYDPYVSKEMRIRDLLCHRSGLGLGEGDLMFWPHTSFTRDDVVYRLRYLKPKTSFRTTYAYNNLMFVTAGQVIAEVSGKSWDEYLREKIFAPLGMKNTNTSATAFKQGDDWAAPHSRVEEKLQPIALENLDNAGPAGSINSSVADMSKWVLLQLDRGRIPGTETRVFSEKVSQEMWAQQMIVPVRPSPAEIKIPQPYFAGYGMGWALRDYKGRKLVSHSGGVAGYVTRVMLVPEENLGVVILTNAEEDVAFESVLYHILDAYLGGPTEDYIAVFKTLKDKQQKDADETMSKAAQARAAGSKPSLALEKYAGEYSDPWYGRVTIKPENGGLVLNFERTEKGLADLQHWQYDTFKAHWRDRTVEDAFVTFTLKPDGAIDHFTMVAVSPLADFSFDFQDLYFTPSVVEKK
jgi:CubicO group peptidase (beta-lactamase class C family)